MQANFSASSTKIKYPPYNIIYHDVIGGCFIYRKVQEQIKYWFSSQNRKPLLLRGARQVGKSTLVRLCAEALGLTLFEINLERHLYLSSVFKSGDLVRIMGELQGLTGEIRDRGSSLLFLDEIQAVPEAIQVLRYFYEDMPDLALIAAGSLLEFTLADHSFSMPVGRITYLHIGPLSFGEFLLAADPDLYRFYSEWKWMDGLPETRLQRILRSLPANLGRKVKFTNFSRDDRAADVKASIDLLCKARICTAVHHSDCSGLPLAAGRDDSTFKVLFLDVGLVCLQLGITLSRLQNMDERTLVNEGALAGQFAGQELLGMHDGKSSPELYYWLREGRSNNAELDYVISENNTIIPIEVKAGKAGTLKSLHQFIARIKSQRAVRFDLNPPSIQRIFAEGVSCELISLPLYMAGRLSEILSGAPFSIV